MKLNLNNVFLLGYRKDSKELLKLFDVLIVPSLSEGMSLSILESQILGTPVIVSQGVPKTNNLHSGLYFQTESYNYNEWYNNIIEASKVKTNYTIQEIDTILKMINYDNKYIRKKLYNSYIKE